MIADTFAKYEEHWIALRILAMPDHLHALLAFPDGVHLKKRVGFFKSWTAKKAGIAWQRDFFDHRIRRQESLEEKETCIAANPVRAGACETPEEWPYFWKKQG